MFRFLFAVFLLVLTTSTSSAQVCDSMDDFEWMEGEWVAESEKYRTYENWTRVSTKTYEGEGRVVAVATGEERSTESIRLVEMSGEIFMLPKAAHNTFPTPFKLEQCGEGEALFENKTHDFPTQLKYVHVGSDSMHVHVRGSDSKGFVVRFGRQSNH
ncbi:MAG: hypothetical protein KTR29_03950 [Rhodothermaceae bacterium]|nr:hypothetical protein [Rhodothermaceae bacterium]